MAKKKAKKKKSVWGLDVSYHTLDTKVQKQREADHKKIMGSIDKRDKQYNQIILLLKQIVKKLK